MNPIDSIAQKHFERRLKRIRDQLDVMLRDAQQIWPEATWYLACDCLHLLSGDSHDGTHAAPRYDREVTSVTIRHISGGDW